MRFVALLKKEFQEIGLIIMLALIAFATLGTLILWNRASHPYSYLYWNEKLGDSMSAFDFICYHQPLRGTGPLLLIISIVLGLLLPAQQFAEQEKRKAWAFIIHRSVRRSTILWAKFTAAAIAFLISLGAVWTCLYLYASRPALFLYPPTPRNFIEGWIFITLGLVVYAGLTLITVSEKKKCAIGVVGIAFAVVTCLLAVIQFSILPWLALILFALIALVANIIDTFLNREF
jgi:hypothetical protein